ncbi:RNA polymerase sigma factor [Roseivirga sp. BDSF3-8]|uniref:RNA polymerase sigma factor n=1 Tax=Roseivirga sp. BDSF3-8 TaxID=3241598 RepID=UPI003532332F
MEDQEIVKRLKNGEGRDHAFRLLVEKYQERMYWHIRKMVIDHEDADDLVQDVFVKVWKGIDRFREDSNLYTWLYRIATNECLTFLNKKKRRFFLPIGRNEGELELKLESDALISGDEVSMRLQKALLKLPDKQRLVFNMRYFDEIAYEDMARITDTSVGALKASYHHAVKKIEEFIREH